MEYLNYLSTTCFFSGRWWILCGVLPAFLTGACQSAPSPKTQGSSSVISSHGSQNPKTKENHHEPPKAIKKEKKRNTSLSSKKRVGKKVVSPKKTARIKKINPKEAALLLYPEKKGKTSIALWKAALDKCKNKTSALQVKCLLKGRYAKDKKALKLAIELYDQVGVVAGLRPKQVRDGGWRGILHMVPQLPIGRRRKHLNWVTLSFKEYKRFFSWLQKSAKKPIKYRYTHISVKFYQTLGKRTPSASAWPWNIAYNLNGSLLWHKGGVRETLYHELFHLNDGDHKNWSYRTLNKMYDGILKKCKKFMRKSNRQGAPYQKCLRPYAPYRTRVARDNVFYAFHRESDVGEYGAELAVRYYLEHRAILLKLPKRVAKKVLGYSAPGAFKCGPTENTKAWKWISKEFFGGADKTAPCP
jgi:hypothetical protein